MPSMCCMLAKSLQSCPALCHPMDCSPPGSCVHGILQARILEWGAMPSSRGSSRPRDLTHISFVSSIGSGFFTISAIWEVPSIIKLISSTGKGLAVLLVAPDKRLDFSSLGAPQLLHKHAACTTTTWTHLSIGSMGPRKQWIPLCT